METTTQPQAGPPPAWQPPAGPRPPLVRSRTDRKLAGVAGGLGAHLGVDPLWLRIGFVVLTAAAGLGILLYLVGWALIPEEGEQAAIGDGLLERLRRAPSWVPILLFVIAGLVFFGHAWGGPVFWGLALVAAGVWLYRNDTHRQAPTPPPWTPPAAGPPGGGPAGGGPASGATAGVTDVPAATWPQQPASGWSGPMPPPYAPPPYGAPTLPLPAPRALPAPRPRRPRSYLGRYTLAALLVVLGVTGALDNMGAFHAPARIYAALALLVVGTGLLLGTLWGRSRGLIVAGLLILPVALAANLIHVPLRGGAGQRIYIPTTAAGVAHEYNLAAGNLRLDLTQVPLGATPVKTRARLGVGQLDVIVPPDATVDLRAHAGLGEIDLPSGRVRNGGDITYSGVLTPDQPPTTPLAPIELNADVSLGQIRIIRGDVSTEPSPEPVVPAPAPPAPPAVP